MQDAQTTLRQLKAAMARKGDMPSLSSVLTQIVESGQQPDADEAGLTNMVLGDFAMTQKVLRLANSAMYASFGEVTTISRAMYVLGSDAVVHLAMGVKMLDNLGAAADTEVARDELSKAVVAGAIARNVASTVTGKEGESVAVATLMRCLGKLLTCFYLPEMFGIVMRACDHVDLEDSTATTELGMSFSGIALEVARSWNLPTELTERTGEPAEEAGPHALWVHHVSSFSRSYVDAVSRGATEEDLSSMAAHFADLIGASATDLMQQAAAAVRQAQGEGEDGKGASFRVDATKRFGAASSPLTKLISGINEIERTKDELPLGRVMSMATEVLWTSLGCRNAMFFLRNGNRGVYDLIQAQGEQVLDQVRKVSFEEAFSPNVVHLALANGSPVFLGNVQDPNIMRRVPDWLKRVVKPAKAFFILPFLVRGKAISVLCLDWGVDSEVPVLSAPEQEQIERLRTLVSSCFVRSVTAQAKAVELA